MEMDKVIADLFIEALKKSGLQYLFTLLRVRGVETYAKDHLIDFKNKVLSEKPDRNFIESSSEYWSLITNLSRVAGGYPYNAYVFWFAESRDYLEEAKKLVSKDLATFLETLFPIDQEQVTQDQIDTLYYLISNNFCFHNACIRISPPDYIEKTECFTILKC